MGVPALFRWLSKKYPKIILPVVEDQPVKVENDSGEKISIPVDISNPNPNDMEFDNLYLDMNGIVHPCTHPEGKPAPETEEEMMVEIFKYTERVVSMIRPRKLLFMAIDGVAPRAKMNQQRSRRFRAAQEAKEKEEARAEAVLMWESMGNTLSEESKTKKSWDTNAITPGTPFMTLLATSLRYWVVQKMNTDPGWKDMQIIISDASVPGEGEHKIMDFIRRQRSHSDHDPNTKHVIYGLDADLIMLALATHEPHFRVLREDVFFQDTSSTACRICGQEGHYAAQCSGETKEVQKKPPEEKPFIFLDVATLREYLEIELNVSHAPFPFDLERAIDDWVLLIFFVGNDFLPHLPSLEIREGAIDTLLKIWKDELPRMGGYLTDHGNLVLNRAEIILDGLAKREDEIFRRRRETEERQDQNAKRRKLEQENRVNGVPMVAVTPSPALQLTTGPTAPLLHPSLPQRPVNDGFSSKADSIGLGAPPTAQSMQSTPIAVKALAGSNHDVVANRHAIRMANLSAAESLKAELAGLIPVKPTWKAASAAPPSSTTSPSDIISTPVSNPFTEHTRLEPTVDDDMEVPGFGSHSRALLIPVLPESNTTVNIAETPVAVPADDDIDAVGELDPDAVMNDGHDVRNMTVSDVDVAPPNPLKRKLDEIENEDSVVIDEDDDAPPPDIGPIGLKVNPDGTVDQEDTVKLWEPGYKERYYRQKFGVELSDTEFRKRLTTCYVEGLAWVLQYYYQGAPSWQWYYPFHFAPFAADFTEVAKMDIKFEPGQPFKPFEQLMGVFPAASGIHIPEVFRSLMVDEDSPIIDYYPSTFEIDMNGKKMAWQGVALLPFIDGKRLLDALEPRYPKLTEDEIRRNSFGNSVLFVSDEHSLYSSLEVLYTKRKSKEPVPVNTKLSKGLSGGLLADPQCLPGSTYYSPLPTQNLPDLQNDRTVSALYFFPKQLKPHRSVLLQGVKRPPRVLNAADCETVRRGGRGRGRDNGLNSYRGDNRRGSTYGGPPQRNSSYGYDDRGPSSRGRNDSNRPPSYQSRSYPAGRDEYDGRGGYGGYGDRGSPYAGGGRGGYQGGRGSASNGYYQDSSYGQSYNASPPPGNAGGYQSAYSGSGGYGGYGESANGGSSGGYGGYGYGSTSNGSSGGYGGYGGYGGGGSGGVGGGYGGYGGYGNSPPAPGAGRGYYSTADNSSRGRARGGRY